MKSLSPLTVMHLMTAKQMPRKSSQVWMGEKENAKFLRRSRKERKLIAAYYRLLRSGKIEGYGPKQARIAHRYGVVKTGVEASIRMKNMLA